MNTDKKAWESVTEWIIGAAMEVQCVLGVGFLEKVYEKALFAELRKQGLEVKAQVEMPVFYKGKNVGIYVADLLVDNTILVELKCAKGLGSEHLAQCLNYLKASNLDICLLMNFGTTRLQWKRIVN